MNQYGHVEDGWEVRFNLDGICACRTLTLETRDEVEQFERLLAGREDMSDVEVVYNQ